MGFYECQHGSFATPRDCTECAAAILQTELRGQIAALEDRRMVQARQIMVLMADLSTARTETARLQGAIEQLYRDSDGHNHCWMNVQRLFQAAGLKPKRLCLPPKDEALAGCVAFWDAYYAEPERWPDFIELDSTLDCDSYEK